MRYIETVFLRGGGVVCALRNKIFIKLQLAPLISWPISSYIFAHDYRTAFLVHAAVTCILALAWLVVFREKPQYHFSVNGLELNKIVAGKIKVYYCVHSRNYYPHIFW